MDTQAMKCRKCNEVISSKRALRRHLRSRHPLEAGEVNDADYPSGPSCAVQNVSDLVDALDIGGDVDSNATELEQKSLNPGAPDVAEIDEKSVNDGKVVQSREVVAVKMEAKKTENGRLVALHRNRRVIDAAVVHLLKAHLRDKTTLSKPTQTIVSELRTMFLGARLPREVYVGITVAAKHFAGTQKPRRNAIVGRSVRQQQGSPVEKAKRRLFVETTEAPVPEVTSETGVAVDVSNPVAESPEVENMETQSVLGGEEQERRFFAEPMKVPVLEAASPVVVEVNVSIPVAENTEVVKIGTQSLSEKEDQDWSRDVWCSYGTRERQVPSPMGCSASPSVIFTESPMRPSTPVEQWSPSSDDFPWGPYTPEKGSQPTMPDGPQTIDDERWFRSRPRRRHHLRSRRASRERYIAQLPTVAVDWSNGEGVLRPTRPSDFKLPSPPESNSSLLQLRRRMLMEGKLPKGCRIQPARASKRRGGDSTNQDVPTKAKNQTKEVPASSAEPESDLPDIDLTAFDDTL